MTLPKNKLIMIGAAAVVVIGLIYYFFFFTADTGSAVMATAPASDAELVFVNLAGQLEPIDFDTSLLTDPRFTALVDIRTTVIPEASGRRDPFSPLSGISATQ